MITNGFTHIVFLISLAGMLLFLEKKIEAKIFNTVLLLIWIYVLNMILCIMGLYNSEAYANIYSVLKNNTLYTTVFVMPFRYDFKKLSKLGGCMVVISLGCSLTLTIGFLIGYPISKGMFGMDAWGTVAALYVSWVGGLTNMTAMQAAPPVDVSAYNCALALDAVYYLVWIAFLLLMVKYAGCWNTSAKTDTSTLQVTAESVNAGAVKGKKAATSADWIFLIGLSPTVSASSQMVGESCSATLAGAEPGTFDKGALTMVFVSILGLICTDTSFGKLPVVEEFSNVHLYVVVSLPASTASVSDLLSVLMRAVYGLFTLVIHVVLIYLLLKVFH